MSLLRGPLESNHRTIAISVSACRRPARSLPKAATNAPVWPFRAGMTQWLGGEACEECFFAAPPAPEVVLSLALIDNQEFLRPCSPNNRQGFPRCRVPWAAWNRPAPISFGPPPLARQKSEQRPRHRARPACGSQTAFECLLPPVCPCATL